MQGHTAGRDPEGAARSASRHLTPAVMVGRVTELEDLVGAVTDTPAVALVEGEAGIGKTRLVRELLAAPALAGRVVLAGGCHPMREPFPYGPVLELLRQIGTGSGTRLRDLNPVTGALRPLLPELDGLLPPTPDKLGDPRAERHRLFRAVRELLAVIGPTVLVVEDLHWADDGSRELLRFLVDTPPREAAFVFTYRGEELSVPGLPLGTAYRPLPEATDVRIKLAPLDTTETGRLAAAILGGPSPSPWLAARLRERSAGIPFVLEELARTLVTRIGPLDHLGAEWFERLPVPALLREALAERVAALSAAAAEAIRAASVLREPTDVVLLAEVNGTELDQTREAVNEALRSGVLCEVSDGAYGFRHGLAQQAAYDMLTGPDRQRLHDSAARALRGVEPPPLVRLAYHAQRSGAVEDWLSYTEQAADQAMAVGDNAVALEVLERALSAEAMPDSACGELAVKLSRAAITGLTCHRALRLLRTVLRTLELPAALRGEIRLNLGLLRCNQAGDNEQGRADMELAVGELAGCPGLAARGMSALGLPPWGDIPLATHQSWLAAAQRSRTGQDDDPALATAVRGDHIALLAYTGEPGWQELAAQLPDWVGSVPQGHHVARAYANFSDAAAWLGHDALARNYHNKGQRLADESGTPFVSGAIDATMLRLDFAGGHWEGLAERGRNMIELTADAPWIAAEARLVVGSLAVARGDWDEATTQLTEITSAGTENSAAPVLAAASGGLARILLATGHLEAGVAEIDRAIPRVRRKGIWTWAAQFAPSAVAVLARAGRLSDAELFTDEFTEAVTDRDAPAAWAAVQSCRAVLAASRGGFADGAEAFDRARRHYLDLAHPYPAARAGEAAVRCGIAAGEARAAELAGIVEEFSVLGASRDAARCRRVLRAAGTGTPSRRGRKGYGSALSPREFDVARQLAGDKTNREIAEVLFLSPRTVEQHVAQVLRKLRVSTRESVAAALGTDRPGDVTARQ